MCVSSLLKTDSAAQVAILRALLGHTDGLRFQFKEEDIVFHGVRPFLDDEDQCLELAKIFIGVTDDRFARISGSEMFFDIATRRGFNKVVEYLTSKAMPSPPTILFTALRHEVQMIPSLIRNGANLHERDENGDTLLHVAMSILTETQCRTITRLLVEAGCDPFMFNNADEQLIHIAISRGLFSVAAYLVSHAFDVKVSLRLDLSNRDYLQLLHAVLKSANAEGECLRTTQFLLETGCIPCGLDPDGEMPLHIAVSRGFTSIIDYLLSQDMPFPSDILLFALQSRPLKIFTRKTITSGNRQSLRLFAKEPTFTHETQNRIPYCTVLCGWSRWIIVWKQQKYSWRLAAALPFEMIEANYLSNSPSLSIGPLSWNPCFHTMHRSLPTFYSLCSSAHIDGPESS
ncbi:ankyrin repeat-containing domain protein [Butyriboletus roseoflavus]|nr:ankyrin repeat-containing domain protein [Butyriboletus roseoflavus]